VVPNNPLLLIVTLHSSAAVAGRIFIEFEILEGFSWNLKFWKDFLGI
jgi:hypothetical protein